MKEVSDTVALRKKIQESFELAALPGTSEEERRKVLHFVVVGGGPTGVEFAGGWVGGGVLARLQHTFTRSMHRCSTCGWSRRPRQRRHMLLADSVHACGLTIVC